jgi:hypothetical protein
MFVLQLTCSIQWTRSNVIHILWQVEPLLGNDCEISNYTKAVVRQWLSSRHVGTLTDTNVVTAQQQRNSVFCVLLAKILQAGQVRSQ